MFRVYVIEDAKGVLYVGSTALALKEKLARHRACLSAGHRVRKPHCAAGERRLRLRFDLMPKRAVYTRELAESIERRTAHELRKRGFVVRGGH